LRANTDDDLHAKHCNFSNPRLIVGRFAQKIIEIDEAQLLRFHVLVVTSFLSDCSTLQEIKCNLFQSQLG